MSITDRVVATLVMLDGIVGFWVGVLCFGSEFDDGGVGGLDLGDFSLLDRVMLIM